MLPIVPALLILLTLCVTCSRAEVPGQLSAVESRIRQGVAEGIISGAVLVAGSRSGDIRTAVVGTGPDGEPLTLDAVFDLASLTKVIATTPAVMKLAEERRLSLLDRLALHLPELDGTEAGSLSIWHLMTHTSGLDDAPIPSSSPMTAILQRISGTRIGGSAGHRFRYADVNFILLGEIVTRVAGMPFDRFVEEAFYRPLRMMSTGFGRRLPAALRIVPTRADRGTMLRGVVQDENARRLGGVAGHAGLFSSAPDLARFCRMLLGSGELDGIRVFRQVTVEQMTAPYFSRGGGVARGLGWDISSPFSSPRGIGLSSRSFGHTGYSGTSLWLDPVNDLFVIFLASRIDYRNRGAFNRIRSDISTLVAEESLILKEILEDTEER